MRKIVLSIFAVLAVSFAAVAQNQRVSGKVTDAKGAPVIGATVTVPGTTTGAMVGADGSYTIQVPANGSLEFRFSGMKTQIVDVNRRTVIDITMEEDAINTGDVLVIAFGQANKTTFTGSAAQLGDEELSKRTSTSVVNTLAGALPGVQIRSSDGQPGSEATIRVRGVTSLSAGTTPLIILDGMEYTGGLSSINNSDIETFTVLKDAASAALYGARGANGVIMITTKKGKIGEAKITVDTKWGVGTREQKDYDVITDPQQHYEAAYQSYYNYYFNKRGYSAAKSNADANDALIRDLGYIVYETNGNPLIGMDGKLYSGAKLGKVYTGADGSQYLISPDNWKNEAYRASSRQEYNVSINAGNDRSSFYGSIGYLNDQGIVAASSLSRFTARLNSEYKAKSWLKVGGNFSFTHMDLSNPGSYNDGANSSGNIFAFTSQMAPIYPVYIRDVNGKILSNAQGRLYDYGDGVYLGLNSDGDYITRPLLAGANPLQQNVLDKDIQDHNQINIMGFATIQFTKDLKLTVQGANSIREMRWTGLTNPYYGQYASQKGDLTKEHYRAQNMNLTQMLDYSTSFGKHGVSAMIGHDFSTSRAWDLYASKNHMFSPDILELYNAVIDGANAGSSASEYMTEGYIARATYDYDQKYFGSASFRRDASTKFHPDHRWGNFWSVSGGWIISSEDFTKSLTWMDLLKFKASIGQRGNDAIPEYSYVNRYNIKAANKEGDISLEFRGPGNPDITWETVTDFNIGFDFGLFNNRLTGSLEYYQRQATDLLFSVPTPPTAGYASRYANIGDMRNNGFELDLHGVVLDGKDYRLTLHGNLTTNKSVVLRLPENVKLKDALLSTDEKSVYFNGFSSGNLWIGEGNAMYTYYLKRYAGVNEYGESQWYQRVLKDENDLSKGTEDVITTKYGDASFYVSDKSAQPNIFGGLGLTFEYMGFDLSINFDYQVGGWSYDGGYASFMSSPTGPRGTAIHKDILKAWTPNNTESNIPRFMFGDSNSSSASDRFLVSSSYLNWGNVNAGYTLPSKWSKQIGIERIRIYASLENINYWTARRGMDPRGAFNGSTGVANYSPIRTVSGGLQIIF